jgi:phosphate transport system substrate-binding protein
MNKIKFLISTTALLAMLCGTAAAEDLAVVVNKSNPVDSLSSAQLKKIVLGQQASWSTGKKVSVVLRSPGQPDRESVLRNICGMSENDYNQFTMHADLNGETLGEPKIQSSAAAVRQAVSANPGAIGFVRVSDVNDSVKAVPVDGVAAGQPGYRLK